MGSACGMQCSGGEVWRKALFEDPDVYGRVTFIIQEGGAYSTFICPRILRHGGLLWTRVWTVGIIKKQGLPSVAQEVLASQKGLVGRHQCFAPTQCRHLQGINVLTHNPCDFNAFSVSCKFIMSVTRHKDVRRIGGTAPYILNFNKQLTSRPGRFDPHSWSDYTGEQ